MNALGALSQICKQSGLTMPSHYCQCLEAGGPSVCANASESVLCSPRSLAGHFAARTWAPLYKKGSALDPGNYRMLA
eukprot:286448-Pelagomonas_calceolata.AAC.1